MITFVLPAGLTQLGSGQNFGTIDGEAIEQEELIEARNILAEASRISIGDIPLPGFAFARQSFAAAQQASDAGQPAQAQQLAQRAAAQAQVATAALQRDSTFYLLLREAREAGTATPLGEVEALLEAAAIIDRGPNEDPRFVRFADVLGEKRRARSIAAAAAVLDVASEAAGYADVARISTPIAARIAAENAQFLTLEADAFDADDYVAQVPPPDEATLQALFDRYRDTPRRLPDESASPTDAEVESPFGFGYRLPAASRPDTRPVPLLA